MASSYDENKLTKLSALKALAEKFKEIAVGEVNKIETIKVNGTAQAITEKAVNITVPTRVGELTNDSGFQTAAQVTTAIQTAISKTGHAKFEIVESVPSATAAQENVLYLFKNTATSCYDIYAKIGSEVVRIDDTTVDLSGYVKKDGSKVLSTNDYTTAEKQKLAGLSNYTHPTSAGNKHVPAGGQSGQILRWKADGEATWGADNNTTYKPFTGANSSAAGAEGLVPAPTASDTAKYLKGDGTWGTPPNTTYKPFTGASSSAAGAEGLVPAPTTSDTAKYLKGDGTWGTPTNTTYQPATQTNNGLMSSTDKKKLDGMSIATDTEVTAMLTEVFAS